jgi:hypothetical protein
VLPADVVSLARLHQQRQQQLALLATRSVEAAWARMSPTDVAGSWSTLVAPTVLQLVVQAQIEAARGVQEYVARSVDLQGAQPAPAGRVQTNTFAGAASDGRPLDTLLGYPVWQVEAFMAGGTPAADALGIGLRHLGRIVATQIQDTARAATGVAIVNDRRVTGYIRVVSGACCSRCAILAGRWYRYNAGFPRHPHCSCTQVAASHDVVPQSPKAIFDSMSPDELRQAGWSQADIKAISEDGADIYQVTNAHRDLRSVTIAGRPIKTTLQGTTAKGIAGKRLKTPIRLTPESIYAEADRLGWSRDETIRQLTRFGYIR